MRRATPVSLLAASLAVIALAVVLVGGCDSGDEEAAPTGGTITGQTYDGTTGNGIGVVRVAVETFRGEISATSTTPDGDFAIAGVPAGTYNRLHVTPEPGIYGQGSDFYVNVDITVQEGANVALPGHILIVDEAPPAEPD